MARIPLQTAQRGLDTGQVVQYPDVSPIGDALVRAGGALQGVAIRVQQRQDEKDSFDAKLRENEMTQTLAGMEDEAVQNAPEDASGLHDSTYGETGPDGRAVKPGNFDKIFDEYLARVPKSKQAEFAAKRESYRLAGSNRMAAAQYKGEQDYYKVSIQKTQNQIVNSMLAGDPNDMKTYDEFKQQGLDIIDKSGLPALEKDVARTNWEANASETLFKLKLAKDPSFAAKARGALGLVGAVKAPAMPQDQQGRATAALSFFMGRGYTKEQAAGIVGNLLQESGLRPSGAVGDNGTAFGIAQWRGERLTKLKRFASANGRDWQDLETQLGFVDSELQQDEPAAYAALKAAKTVDEATAAFIGFERPRGWTPANPRGGHGWANRLGYAAKVAGVEVPAGAADPAFANIPPDRRLVLANQADVQVNEQQRTQLAEQNAQYAAYKDALELQIVQGKVRDDAIISNDNTLTDGDKATLLRSLHAENKDNAGVDAILASLTAGGKAPINPFDGDQTRVGDKAYDSLISAVPAEQRQTVGEAYVAGTGYVPKRMAAEVQQSLSSTVPQTVGEGMERASRIYQIAPSGLSTGDGTKEIRDAAVAFNDYVYNRGLSRDEAGKRWADLHSPEALEKQARLKPLAADFLKTLAISDVTNAFDTAFTLEPSGGLTPDQQQAVMSDYSRIAEEKFAEAGGDPKLAKQLALADMKKLYGVSEVSGSSTVMKFPPEKYYPPVDGKWDYIRQSAMDDVKGIDADAQNVMLIPTKETADDIRAGQLPRYGILYQDGNGVWNEVAGQRFTVNKDEINIRQDAAREKRINDARLARETILDHQAQVDEADRQYNEGLAKAREQGPIDYEARKKLDLQRENRLMQPTPQQSKVQQDLADERAKVNEERRKLLGTVTQTYGGSQMGPAR